MKKTIPLLLFLITLPSFAQFTLEKTYNNSKVTRIKLENSGKKYTDF